MRHPANHFYTKLIKPYSIKKENKNCDEIKNNNFCICKNRI